MIWGTQLLTYLAIHCTITLKPHGRRAGNRQVSIEDAKDLLVYNVTRQTNVVLAVELGKLVLENSREYKDFDGRHVPVKVYLGHYSTILNPIVSL